MDNVNLYSDTVNTNQQIVFNYDYANNDKSLGKESNAMSKVEIRLSCEELPNLDATSKTDPRIYVFFEERRFQNDQVSSNWVKIGSTETIQDSLNPEFTQSFVFDYYFEHIQNLRFVVMDMDEKVNMEDNDFIGYVETSLSEMFAVAKDNVCRFPIKNEVPLGMNFKKASGTYSKTPILNISIEILKDNNLYVVMDISGQHLDKKDVLGKSDPYFIISKKTADGRWLKVYESIIIKNTLNPQWTKIDIPLLQLTSGDDKKVLKFDVWDWDKNQDPDYIGGFEADFETIKTKKEFELINEKLKEKSEKKEAKEKDKKKKDDKKKYQNSGVIVFDRIDIKEDMSFSHFSLGGTEFDIDFAIDFTNSNGEPEQKNFVTLY